MTTQNDVIRHFKRHLPVQLTEEQQNQYGKLLAEKVKEEEAVEAEKKQAMKEYATRLSKIRNDQSRLAEVRSKGEELREVECLERWRAGMVELVRLDTDAVFDTRAITIADQQQNLPNVATPGEEPRGPGQVIPFSQPKPTLGVVDGGKGEDPPTNSPDESPGEMSTSSVGDGVFVGSGDRESDDPSLARPQLSDEEKARFDDEVGDLVEQPTVTTPPGEAPQLSEEDLAAIDGGEASNDGDAGAYSSYEDEDEPVPSPETDREARDSKKPAKKKAAAGKAKTKPSPRKKK